ncbi:MAG: hypothetical protein MJZ74_01095 [Muribaculaceae bacterium]|nr:hypothetical protein [Muribaculaceae bacterium]
MKKYLFIAAALFAAAFTASAEDYETPANEISASVGYFTHPHVALTFGDAFGGIIDGDASPENSVGSFGLTYMHNFNNRFGVGATTSFEHIYKNAKDGKKYTENFITVMPTARAYWFRHKSFGMYSRVAAGVALNCSKGYVKDTGKEKTDTDVLFGFHLAPVSMEFGSNKVSGFLELGWGYQGIFNAGVKFGF